MQRAIAKPRRVPLHRMSGGYYNFHNLKSGAPNTLAVELAFCRGACGGGAESAFSIRTDAPFDGHCACGCGGGGRYSAWCERV